MKEIFLQALLDAGIDKYIIKGGTLIAAFTCKKSSKNFHSVVSLIETIHSKLIAFLPRFETATGIQGTIYFANFFGYGKKLGLNQSDPTFIGERFDRFSSIAYSERSRKLFKARISALFLFLCFSFPPNSGRKFNYRQYRGVASKYINRYNALFSVGHRNAKKFKG